MPAVARTNVDAGGDIINSGSGDVIVNGNPCARKTDTVNPHDTVPSHTSGPPIVAGSGSVIVNGLECARVGDPVDCGHSISTGSNDVFAGDGSGGSSEPPATVFADEIPPSALFSGSPSPAVTISPAAQAVADSATRSYVANPSAYRLAPGTDEDNQVKQNYAGTVEDGGSGASIAPSAAAASDIPSFLRQVLSEAATGCWRETGQDGKQSNPNIVGIWPYLGYPKSGCWTTDQTAWCMGFVNFVLKNCGYRYVQTAGAKDIQNRTSAFGATSIPLDQGLPGDIVLWNYSHVNFIYSGGGGKYTFCGGNQSPKNKGNNPNDGDVTNSWPGGWTTAKGGIVGIWRPSKA
jgi:uncharacterized Zn-binding protein involved in type VI secretion